MISTLHLCIYMGDIVDENHMLRTHIIRYISVYKLYTPTVRWHLCQWAWPLAHIFMPSRAVSRHSPYYYSLLQRQPPGSWTSKWLGTLRFHSMLNIAFRWLFQGYAITNLECAQCMAIHENNNQSTAVRHESQKDAHPHCHHRQRHGKNLNLLM